MCRFSKSTTLLTLVLIVSLTACAPAATPASPTATNPPLPTNTPMPTRVYSQIPIPMSVISGKFDVGGHKLYLECYSEGSPTVVLENGYDVRIAASWYRIVPNIASTTRVCVYARANTAESDSVPGPRTLALAADDLNALMAAAKVDGPYLLAGHSLGGFFVLSYASLYPSKVAGVVLVDSAYLDDCKNILKVLSTPAPDEIRFLSDLRAACQTDDWTAEEINFEPEMRLIKSLGAIPLTVLVRNLDSIEIQQWYPGAPTDLAAKLEQAWRDGQKTYTQLSSNSTYLVAAKSGHFIQNDEPQLVIDAILNLVDTARQK